MKFLIDFLHTVILLPFLLISKIEHDRFMRITWGEKYKGQVLKFCIPLGLIIFGALSYQIAGKYIGSAIVANISVQEPVKKAEPVEPIKIVKAKPAPVKDKIAKIEKIKEPQVKTAPSADPKKRIKNYMLTANSIRHCKQLVSENAARFPSEDGFCEMSWKQAQVFVDGTKAQRANMWKYSHLQEMGGITIVNISKDKSFAVPFYISTKNGIYNYMDDYYNVDLGVKKTPRSFRDVFEVDSYFN